MPERPLPLFPEPDTEPFWAATADHRLTYQVCTHCGQVVFHPRRHCTGCTEGEPEWRGSARPGPGDTFTGVRPHRPALFSRPRSDLGGLVGPGEGVLIVLGDAAGPRSGHPD